MPPTHYLNQENKLPADGMSWLGRRGPWRPRQGRGHPRHPHSNTTDDVTEYVTDIYFPLRTTDSVTDYGSPLRMSGGAARYAV